MFWILAFFLLAQAELKVESPDELRNLEFNVQVATFGDPGLYANYGKIIKIERCKLEKKLDYGSVVLVKNISDMCIAQCAGIVEELGGSGLIVLQNSPKLIENHCGYTRISVFVLGIDKKVYENYLEDSKHVWITYKYQLVQSSYPYIELKLNGNVTLDLKLVHSFLKLNAKFEVNWEYVRLQLIYNNENTNSSRDCITTPSKSIYCKQGSTEIPGQQILEVFSIILNVYEQFKSINSTTKFLSFIRAVFLNCEYDYSCTNRYAKEYVSDLKIDSGVLDRTLTIDPTPGRFVLNSVNIIWLDYLESAFCLSFYEPPTHCELCSPGCYFSDLKSENCSIRCDNRECGFSNLVCLKQSGCYNFMVNDGNCNQICQFDPDCNNDGEYVKFFIYVVLTCCIIIFIVFFGTSLAGLCKKSDPSLLAGQIKSTCEMELRSQQIEDIPIKLCPLDMTEIGKDDEEVVTPCNHAFHLECIKKVMVHEVFLYQCPCCRQEFKDFKIIK